MPPERDVVIVGEFFIDEILSEFLELPKLGEESFARKFHREAGGGAAITACGLAKLGVSVAVLGTVGKRDGNFIIDRLTQCGVDCAGLTFHPQEPTGLTVSVSTREDRAFFSYYGANQRLPQVLKKPQTLEWMKSARHVHFACAPDAEMDAPLIQALRRRRVRISIDVQSHTSWLTEPESLNILRHCDLFFPNEREAEWISGEAGAHKILRALREKGLRGVALKRGGKGAALMWRGREFLTDAYSVDTVDTTGAGDCFDAGFIYAWLRNEKPQRCLEIANLCGALSTRALGGVAAFPSLQELQDSQSRTGQKT
ncbi:MAG TPA: carbohydrate kinase family protein [Bryobacteraceae bacterium]|nr:carbohydrate kinase family protein [Bryobacteraceae bacterium]